MNWVRILVDGYSLLHKWEELAPGRPRHSQAARDELVHWLGQFGDAAGVPVTVVFDGGNAPAGTPEQFSTPELEILFSKAGQTADHLIERVASRLAEFGDVLVVTDDYAEQTTVEAAGCSTAGSVRFREMMEQTLARFQNTLENYNRNEHNRFRKG